MGDEQRSITSLKTTAKEWARKVGIDSIDRLNEMIDSGKGLELILVCEAMQSNCMYEIARKVSEQKRRIILISGPSSAGKTTLSHRLSIQLRAMGLRPHALISEPCVTTSVYSRRRTVKTILRMRMATMISSAWRPWILKHLIGI